MAAKKQEENLEVKERVRRDGVPMDSKESATTAASRDTAQSGVLKEKEEPVER